MKMIEPTYLRTIYDGLLSGTIHKDNASTLPIGLIGIYEEALPPASNLNERKKFLEFFAVWALLKKEVSAAFVVPLLEGWTEEDVLDYISQYSKWFNSPVSGKFVLYHERFRSFLLQKIEHVHFTACNKSNILNCKAALQAKSNNEWEHYALEHLSTHLLIQAIESKNVDALKTLAYDTVNWNRQVEISKGFEWSKRMLNNMMLWASKYDDDEVIECSLNKVDLHHQEQNDAPRIVELVAQNDIETTLQRIESFGGNDKEGLQRKFILYMLCLMELTLLECKDKPFRKDAIEKLLKHLDKNLPVDHSVLNWNDFFPSYLIFQMVYEIRSIYINYDILYERSDSWGRNWNWILKCDNIEEDIHFEILLYCSERIEDKYWKCVSLIDICVKMIIKERVSDSANIYIKAFETFQFIEDFDQKDLLNNRFIDLNNLLISDNRLSNIQIRQLEIIRQEIDDYLKEIGTNSILKEKAIDFASKKLFENSIEQLSQISSSKIKLEVFEILVVLSKSFNLLELSIFLSNESLKLKTQNIQRVSEILDYRENYHQGDMLSKSSSRNKRIKLRELNSILVYNSLNELIVQLLNNISYSAYTNFEEFESKVLLGIVKLLASNSRIEHSVIVAELLVVKNDNNSFINKKFLFAELYIEFSKQGLLNQAIDFAKTIYDENEISKKFENDFTFKGLAIEASKQNRIKECSFCINSIKEDFEKRDAIEKSIIEFELLSNHKAAIKLLDLIDDESYLGVIISKVINELVKKSKVEDAAKWISEIGNKWLHYKTRPLENSLSKVCLGFFEKGKIDKSLNFFQNPFPSLIARAHRFLAHPLYLFCRFFNNNVKMKSVSFIYMTISLFIFILSGYNFIINLIYRDFNTSLGLELVFNFLSTVFFIVNPLFFGKILKHVIINLRSETYFGIAIQLLKNGNITNGEKYLKKALKHTSSISGDSDKIQILFKIAFELKKIDKNEQISPIIIKAKEIANSNNDNLEKALVYMEIFMGLQMLGAFDEAKDFIDNSIELALNGYSFYCLPKIINCLVIHGQHDLAIKLSEKLFQTMPEITNNSDEVIKYIQDHIEKSRFSFSELFVTKILQSNTEIRIETWQKIGIFIYGTKGYESAMKILSEFSNPEAIIHIRKGVIDAIEIENIKREVAIDIFKYPEMDMPDVEKVLNYYAIDQLFFSNIPQEKLDRFNRTLNIQWAIDIKNQLPN